MRKISLLLSVLLTVAVLALAVGAAPVEYEPDSTGAFDVTYTGTAGEYYALVIVEGIADEGTAPVITESSIQYIDQVTADASGTAAFNGILLKTDGTPCTVYLGGSDLEAAVLLGYVNNGDETYTVSGTVTSDSAKEASVTLTSTADAAKTFTVTTVSGSYTVSVPADTYKFVVTKAAHLSYTKNELAVADNVTKDVTLKGGDVNSDDIVDFDDLTELVLSYSSESATADVTGDGIVNFDDLTVVVLNYLEKSVTE
ncbi:MAG: hypothetical protein ACI4RV_02500 [Eubacteriales bacterium]